MSKSYPKMLYLGGTDITDYRVVADEAAQKAAEADGYLPLDMEGVKGPVKPAKAEKKAKG